MRSLEHADRKGALKARSEQELQDGLTATHTTTASKVPALHEALASLAAPPALCSSGLAVLGPFSRHCTQNARLCLHANKFDMGHCQQNGLPLSMATYQGRETATGWCGSVGELRGFPWHRSLWAS